MSPMKNTFIYHKSLFKQVFLDYMKVENTPLGRFEFNLKDVQRNFKNFV